MNYDPTKAARVDLKRKRVREDARISKRNLDSDLDSELDSMKKNFILKDNMHLKREYEVQVFMPRIPYEIVAIEANRILIKMAITSSWEESYHFWDLYLEYIDACGWTDREFDRETLRRIDLNWEISKRKVWN